MPSLQRPSSQRATASRANSAAPLESSDPWPRALGVVLGSALGALLGVLLAGLLILVGLRDSIGLLAPLAGALLGSWIGARSLRAILDVAVGVFALMLGIITQSGPDLSQPPGTARWARALVLLGALAGLLLLLALVVL